MKQLKYTLLLPVFLFICCSNTFGQEHAPLFILGHSQFRSVCENTPSFSINTLLAIIDSDAGDNETWSLVTAPAHGAAVAAYTTLSIGDTLIPAGLTYTPATGYSGTDTFSVSISDGTQADTTTIYITINPLPSAGSITGPSGICSYGTITLADGVTGGVWSSDNTAITTINASTGVDTGLTAGSTIIRYTVTNGCGSASTSIPFTVDNTVPPFPAGVTGLHAGCIGSSVALNDATPGGKWLSSNQAVASVDSATGQVMGMSAGVAAITYSESNFCVSYYRTISFTVNPVPVAISGSYVLCTGVSSILTDAVTGGSWSSSATTIASVGLYSGVVTGYTAGTAMITYSAGVASCKTTAFVTVNVTPSAFTVVGGGAYCSGSTGAHVGLNGSAPGVRYQLYRSGSATSTMLDGTGSALDFGAQTLAGSYSIVGTDTITGCDKNMFGAVTVSINTLPTAFAVTGGGGYCAGGAGNHIYLLASQAGMQYQLYNGPSPAGVVVAGTGGSLDFGISAAAGVYTVVATNTLTGCTRTMAGSATITIEQHPLSFDIIGGGSYCIGSPGVHIGLDSSTLGVDYQLLNGTALYGISIHGTGIPLDLGLVAPAGVYTILATNASTGCTSLMPGSTTIVINPLPLDYFVSGGGGYCIGDTGRHITLPHSQTGVGYQLYNGAILTGPAVVGTGSAIDLGLQSDTGTYTILATGIITGCANEMDGSATITIDSLPAVHAVTGGGSYCAGSLGVYIDLDGSDMGIKYQLYYGADSLSIPQPGSGGPLNLGLYTASGSYTVVAINAVTGCKHNMTGSATVTENPLPSPITGTDSVFIGATTTLSNATPGGTWSSNYTSLATVGPTGIVYGDSVGRDTIVYTLPTGCTAKMEVIVKYTPVDTSLTIVGQVAARSTGITVFPNPSAGSLNIKWDGQTTGPAEIMVTNITGQVVYRTSVNINDPSGQVQISPDLNEGAYLLSIRSAATYYTSELMIRH